MMKNRPAQQTPNPQGNTAIDFMDRLAAGLSRCEVRAGRVLLAVSGGADSVALLRGMLEVLETLKLDLVAAHLNHNLRGDPSREEALWVKELCERLGVPVFLGSEDVASAAELKGQGLEETARQIRYAFLKETAVRQRCAYVAVAHTAGDQAETILHHVIRGTGIAGLCGMPRTRELCEEIVLIRPLLEIHRNEIELFLADLGQPFRNDDSNRDPAYTRNRIRNSLLPVLRENYNPQVDEALLRLGRQAESVQQTLEFIVAELLEAAIEDKSDAICRLNCSRLADCPRHLIRECMTALWKNLHWPRQQMGFHEWDRLAELVLTAGTATFPGSIEARRRGKLLVLRRR